MKKALLIGAVVSSMALSSVAFAAVDYQNATAWTSADYAYNKTTGVLTLVGDKTNANATTDTTIVVVAGEQPAEINQSNIMYIDQAASAATYGEMGLLLPDAIADGAKATVLFNDGTAAIYTATFELKEAKNVPDYEPIKWGDVNGSGAANAEDAAAVLGALTGTANAGPFAIGTDIKVVDLGTETVADPDYKWGDVNCSGAANAEDAAAILGALTGTANAGDYAIGTDLGAYAK